MKRCPRCNETKPFDAFGKDANASTGYRPACKACRKIEAAKHYAENVESEKARKIARRARDPEKAKERDRANNARHAEYHAAYNEKHREKRIEFMRNYYAENAERMKRRASEYRKANPVKTAMWRSLREMAKLQATPKWANLVIVEAWYIYAQEMTKATGIPHHVDHIVPLRGKTVCGLHNEFNLQILTLSENSSKGNRHWPDMP